MATTRLILTSLALALLWAFAPGALAQELRAYASVDQDSVYAGAPFTLFVTVEGARSAEPLALERMPEFAELSPVELGGTNDSQTSISFVNGQQRQTVFQRYVIRVRLTAPKPGTLSIPSIPVVSGGKTLRTEPFAVNVVAPVQSDDFKLLVQIDKARLYVGEPTPIRFIWLRRRSEARSPALSIARSPHYELIDPHEDFFREKYPRSELYEIPFDGRRVIAAAQQVTHEGREYYAIIVDQLLIPRRPGAIEVGPSSVSSEIVTGRRRPNVFDSVFSDNAVTQRHTASAQPLRLDVLALPEEGRPRDFSGLVGSYTVETKASPTTVHVGDPIAFTIRVSGPPPLDLIPDLRLEDQPELASNFRLTPEGAPRLTGRAKEFSATLRAKGESATRIPPIELSYFDVLTGAYKVARSAPIALDVRPTREVTLADAVGGLDGDSSPAGRALESAAGGLAPNDESPAILAQQSFDARHALTTPAGLAATLATPALALGAMLVVRLRRTRASDAPSRRKRRALRSALGEIDAAAASPDAPAQVARAVSGYIGSKCDVAGASLTAGECAQALRRRGVDEGVTAPALDVLARCDAARFAGMTSLEIDQLRADARSALQTLSRALEGRS